MNELQLRRELAAAAVRLWERQWVANHDGNLSLRLPRGRLLCTPTGVSKREVHADGLLLLDEHGKVLAGNGRPFSELNLHLAIYQARADVHAVIHAHPPAATGIGVAGLPLLERPFLPEAVVSLGPVIPTVPLSLPGEESVRAAAPYLDEYDAVLLAGNGVLAWGNDLEQAYLRLELVEHLARVALAAQQAGGIVALPAHFLPPLLAARARAGLGPEARGRATTIPESRLGADQTELEKVVRQEVRRVLYR